MKVLRLIILASVLITGMQSCYFSYHEDSFCISGRGNIVSEEIFVDDFNAIVNQTVVDVIIEQGDVQSVEIEGHQNMIDEMKLSVNDDQLFIGLQNKCYNDFRLTVYITVPDLKEIKLQSTGDVEIGDFNHLSSLHLSLSSTGDIIGTGVLEIDNTLEIDGNSTGDVLLEVYTNEVLTDISGTGDINLSGSCTYQNIDMSGTADYKAYDLESELCDVRCAGTGDAKVNVSDELNVTIRSTGDVYYIGSPTINLTNTGVGDLIKAQ